MSNTNYIWTKHALSRLGDRQIPQSLLNQALYYPDRTFYKDGTIEVQKRIEDRTFAVIMKENEKGEKIILSCWVNPPYPGTKDAKNNSRYHQMQKASVWKKIWLTILSQLGL